MSAKLAARGRHHGLWCGPNEPNILTGPLLAVATVVVLKWEAGGILVCVLGLLLLGFLALGGVNLLSTFLLWKRYRLRAFIPLGTFALAAVISALGAYGGAELVLRGTPCRPRSFFQAEVREELTRTAEGLVGNGYKTIWIGSGVAVKVRMIAGLPQRDVAPEIVTTLRKYGFQRAYIDLDSGRFMRLPPGWRDLKCRDNAEPVWG